MNRDGKEENPASIRCLTMLLRCLQDSSTVPLRLMPAALRFTPMELRMSRMLTMWSRFDTLQQCFSIGRLFKSRCRYQESRVMRKPAFCICENKDADQLRGNRESDQRLCFRYIDNTIPLLCKSEISSL